MITALFLVIIIVIVTILSEALGSEGLLNHELSKKIPHITAGIAAAFSVIIVDSKFVLILFGSILTIITFLLIKYDVLKTIRKEKTKSWGVFFLPVAYTILVLFLFPVNKEIIFLSMILFGISDSAAAIVGEITTENHFYLTSDKKSIIGSVIFFCSTLCILILFFAGIIQFEKLINIFFSLSDIIFFSLATALIITVIEAMSSKGSDNFFVPIFSAVLLYIFIQSPYAVFIQQFIIGVLLALFVALISIRFKFLTLNGSAATFVLASFIFGLGSWQWSLPIMTFFILSSILSKLRKKNNENIEAFFEKSGTRDYLQVLANGGIGGLLVIYNEIFPSELNYYIYLASLAAVCADTWATEIGTFRKRATYNILNFKKIEQGTSGGISLVGTIGALAGSFVIALSGFLWVNINLTHYFILIIGAGLFGSFFDSVLGATIQSQGRCKVCNKITERDMHCGQSTKYFRGYTWLNNDVVNFFAGVSSAVLIIIVYFFN